MERILKDGTVVNVRPIAASDKHGLSVGLRALSPETVQRRFLTPKRRFSTGELRYLTEVDGHDHVALVAEPRDAPGRIIAVGRWVRLPGEARSAEFAIVVADELQGRGLGSLLADELAATAKLNGITRFTASALAENEPILRILRRLGTHLERRHTGMGTTELAADLAA